MVEGNALFFTSRVKIQDGLYKNALMLYLYKQKVILLTKHNIIIQRKHDNAKTIYNVGVLIVILKQHNYLIDPCHTLLTTNQLTQQNLC